MAPKLAPTTLAQATKYGAQATKYGSQAKGAQKAPTLDDFPSLKPEALKAPEVPEAPKATFNYASLSRDWAKKQKEDEIAKAAAAATEAMTQRILHEKREKELAENQMIRRIRVGMAHIPRQRKPDSDEEKYSEKSSEEEPLSDEPEEVYEEEEEEDDDWNGRKHRDELY